MLDIQLIVLSEQRPYHSHVTPVDRLPYAAAAHLRTVVPLPDSHLRLMTDQLHSLHVHSVSMEQPVEFEGVGVAMSSTPKVLSDHDTANGNTSNQLADELFTGKLTEAVAKVNDDQIPDTHLVQIPFLLSS